MYNSSSSISKEVSKHRADKAKEFKKDLREAIKNYSDSNLNDKQVEHIAEYADEHFERFPVEYYVSDICNLVGIIDKVVNLHSFSSQKCQYSYSCSNSSYFKLFVLLFSWS